VFPPRVVGGVPVGKLAGSLIAIRGYVMLMG
jgi:hypothetical protein